MPRISGSTGLRGGESPGRDRKSTGPVDSGPTGPAKPFNPTHEQQQVIQLAQWMASHALNTSPPVTPSANILTVTGVPGCGKTATAVHAIANAYNLNRNLDFRLLAFNTTAADELDHRIRLLIPGLNWQIKYAAGTHSYGFGLIRQSIGRLPQLDRFKYWNISREIRPKLDESQRRGLVAICDMYRNKFWQVSPTNEIGHATNEQDTTALIAELGGPGLPYHETLDVIRQMIKLGLDWTVTRAIVDHTDMISTPAYLGLKPQRIHDIMIVDEFQDNNAAQIAMVWPCTQNLIVIGDQCQAIYGFRGAGYQNMQDLLAMGDNSGRTTFSLALTYNFRSDLSIVSLAQHIVPYIRPRDNAPDGEVMYNVSWEDFVDAFKGNMGPDNTVKVLARRNAPIVRFMLFMLKNRVPVYRSMRDDEQDTLTKTLLESVAAGRKFDNLHDMSAHVREYYTTKIKEVQDKKVRADDKDAARRKQRRIADLTDLWECMSEIISDQSMSTPNDVVSFVQSLAPKSYSPQAVEANTIHRAKGTEADNVYIIGLEYFGPESRGYLDSPYGLTDMEWDQEINLAYVAITRARHHLLFNGPKPRLLTQPVRYRVCPFPEEFQNM